MTETSRLDVIIEGKQLVYAPTVKRDGASSFDLLGSYGKPAKQEKLLSLLVGPPYSSLASLFAIYLLTLSM